MIIVKAAYTERWADLGHVELVLDILCAIHVQFTGL